MHRRITLCLLLCVVPVTLTFESPTSILDLFSWNLEDRGESAKRDSSDDSTVKACTCNGSLCECCIDFDMVLIDFGGPGCVHMKYISQEEGIAVNVSYGESLLHSMAVKGPNPDPTCMPILEDVADVCTQFTNVQPVDGGYKGCVKLQPKILGQMQTQFNVGCFTIGADGMKLDTMANLTKTYFTNGNLTGNSGNAQKPQPDEFNEEELMAAVNETAEKGLVFLGKWLGLFGKPDVKESNTEASNESIPNTETSSLITDSSRRARVSLSAPKYNKV